MKKWLNWGKPHSEASQLNVFTRRAALLGGAQAALGVGLCVRMGWIAIAENERYNLLSESNRVNLTLTPPRRGWIADRFGKALADNRSDYRADIIPARLVDPDRILARLSELIGLTPDDLDRIRRQIGDSRGFKPVEISARLTPEQYLALSIRANELPGVAPSQGYARNYPTGAAVGHLLGYIGAPSAEEYEKTKDPLYVTPGYKIGKQGLEKSLDAKLKGIPGAKRTEVTARGKPVRDLATREDVPGDTVKLTIDAGLQEFASRRLGTESGAVVIMDCNTGGILAMTSMPCFDPNSFSEGIGSREYAALSADERIPLLNKTVQGLYPPGSTFKAATAMALQMAGVDPEDTVNCGGGYTLGNRRFACLGTHGSMNMHRAIAKSCNTYFYTMGRRVGIEKIAPAAHLLGLGEEFPLPLPSQKYGTVPDPAWKMKRYKQEWSQADTLNTSIGQGYLQISPLQLAVMAARVASGKKVMPQLLAGKVPKPQSFPGIPEEYFANIRSGMDEVVNGNGTAGRSKLPLEGIKMGGKTGTAQVRNYGSGSRKGGAWKSRDHGLFVFFAPVDNPQYAGAVVIEHGMSGSGAAAPVGSDCLLYLFDEAKAMEKLAGLEAGWGGDIKTRMARQAAEWENAPAPGEAPPEDPVANQSQQSREPTPTEAAAPTTPVPEDGDASPPSSPAPPRSTEPAPATTPAAPPQSPTGPSN